MQRTEEEALGAILEPCAMFVHPFWRFEWHKRNAALIDIVDENTAFYLSIFGIQSVSNVLFVDIE